MSIKPLNQIDKKVALLTKHKKQELLAPMLHKAFASEIIHTDEFDTDTLGAFDNSVQRTLTPAKAALKKAYLACELTSCNQGIGSEGSFSGMFGIGNMNEEVLAFVDVKHGVEIIAIAKQASPFVPITAINEAELSQALGQFEGQKWMLQTTNEFVKGLDLHSMLDYIQTNKVVWPVKVEPDFRAMHCPLRQVVIKKAMQNLLLRMSTLCPKCTHLNFVPDKAVSGLPCELCTLPTHQVKYWLSKCESCGYEQRINETSTPASAFNCDFCNP